MQSFDTVNLYLTVVITPQQVNWHAVLVVVVVVVVEVVLDPRLVASSNRPRADGCCVALIKKPFDRFRILELIEI